MGKEGTGRSNISVLLDFSVKEFGEKTDPHRDPVSQTDTLFILPLPLKIPSETGGKGKRRTELLRISRSPLNVFTLRVVNKGGFRNYEKITASNRVY